MQIYRTRERHAASLLAALQERHVEARIERYSPDAVYVIVTTNTFEAARIAHSFGHGVRRVQTIEELANQPTAPDS